MTNESQKTLDALRALALKDLDAASDDEIRAEFIEDGIDADALVANMMASLDEMVSAHLRQQAVAAKIILRAPAQPMGAQRPSIERIKEIIARTFSTEPQLAAAFRDGTRQSDADLQSLYDDLVLMGKVPPRDDGR